MIDLRKVAMLAVALGAFPVIANAGDPACAAPPYGSSMAKYKSFMDTLGMFIWQSETKAQVFLAAICDAKLSHAPDKLEALHRIGISDGEIAAMTMSELWIRYIDELQARLKQRAE